MTSSNPLSPDLISSLLSFTDTFRTSAARFRNCLSGNRRNAIRDDDDTGRLQDATSGVDEFTRVCELHNTLDMISTSKAPAVVLWNLRGHGHNAGLDQSRDAEDLLSFMLNAEFVLFEMYRIYDIRLNPSLAHWVGICRDFENYSREHSERNAEWGLRESVLKARAAFVKGILGDQGDNLAHITPDAYARGGFEFDIDINSFREALFSQGNYEDEQPDTPAQDGTDDSGYVSMRSTDNSIGYSPGPTPVNDHEAQARMTHLIMQATSDELSPEVTERVLSYLDSRPELLSSYPLDLLGNATLVSLFTKNPNLTRGLVSLILRHGDQSQRQEMINSIQFLPVTLQALEILNEVVNKPKLLNQEEKSVVVSGMLENSIRTVEAMRGTSTAFGAASSGLGEGFDLLANGGGTSVSSRQAQDRIVKLLCLFIQSLLRNDIVGFQELYYQIQNIGVKFFHVKEARDLWRTYCAN